MKNATALEMAQRILEYAKDPNCFADLWATDKMFSHFTKEEKDAFIAVGVVIKRLDMKCESLSVS